MAWDRPLLTQAVEFLAGDWKGTGPLDLSDTLVVVATRHSGRRLREAIAEYTSTMGSAAFAPRLETADSLLDAEAGRGAASRLESLLAWGEALRTADLERYREVLPVDPPERSISWSLRLAEQMISVQSIVAEAGLRLADVPAKAGEDFAETARWTQLAALESEYGRRLAQAGWTDPQAARIAWASAPPPPEGIRRIILLAHPDPLPIVLSGLERLAEVITVEVVVYAPDASAHLFDDWGRPRIDAWESRVWSPPDFESRVHLCADPAAQADSIAALARSYPKPEGRLGIGVADAEIISFVGSALERAGMPPFNPAGRMRRAEGIHHLLSLLAALAREPRYETIESLARCPDFLAHLERRGAGTFSAARWLEGLDRLHARHMPADLAAAREHAVALVTFPELESGLAAVGDLIGELRGEDFATGAAAGLRRIYSGARTDFSTAAGRRFEEAAAGWMDLVRACAASSCELPAADWWDLALRLFGDMRATEEKAEGALELQGWLELLWENAPHLAIAGCNDGSLPDSIAGDAFVPEALRERLGLKTNGFRFARDAYVLAAVSASRDGKGRVDLFLGKASEAGDPRRPSRLLFQCADEELPRRVEFLFRNAPPGRSNPPWRRAWLLHPAAPMPGALERLPVTGFRDYLHCPFRFYLKHGLGMTTVDASKLEMDALDFGTLCHAALEAMGRESALRGCTDSGLLREFLLARFDAAVRQRFGTALALPVLFQVESGRQRLSRAAEVQARQCELGWIIEATEHRIDLSIGALRVVGKIDRIERNHETGRRRVLDYKTSDAPATPRHAHVADRRPRDGISELARFELEGRERYWLDLQLPLYLEALAPGSAEPIELGYFNLPKAVGETAVETWEDFDGAWRAAAVDCARRVAAAVRSGLFWPPSERVKEEEPWLEGLFHHGAEASVDAAFAADPFA